MICLKALLCGLTIVWAFNAVCAADAAFEHVAKHLGIFTQPPRGVPTRGMPDGPLLGNGDVGVTLAGPPEARVFYIGKNDFWTRHPANAKVINEMLLQSHEGVIRFFPVWPKEENARFGGLRAVGAFLVSAELKDGTIRGVTLHSEKGRACTVQNPWPGKQVQLVRNGNAAETVAGARFRFHTAIRETIQFREAH